MNGDWLHRLERQALDSLHPAVGAYFAGVAEGGESVADARREWDAVRFAPRAFGGSPEPSLGTTVLGTAVETPVLVAPMGQQTAADAEGERAMGRAVARSGSLLGVSATTAVPFAEIAETAAPWWFQHYPLNDPSLSRRIVARAVAAGAAAIMLTVDLPALTPDGSVHDPTAGFPDGISRARFANVTDDERNAAGVGGGDLSLRVAPSTITALREQTGLDVVVKGILRAEDAWAAVEAGAAGVVVSTHGGRRLGRSISSLRALPAVVEAVGDRAEVFVDSGVRRGDHVAAALALGARAVFVGRPALWGLSTGGERGAADVIRILSAELAASMRRLGAASPAELRGLLVEA